MSQWFEPIKYRGGSRRSMSCNCLKKLSENFRRVQLRDLYKKCFCFCAAPRPAPRRTQHRSAPLRAWVPFRESPSFETFTKKCFCFCVAPRPAPHRTQHRSAPLRAWVPFRESPSFETFTKNDFRATPSPAVQHRSAPLESGVRFENP